MRAEELVAYIYSRKVALQNEGGKPSKVVMNMECWRHIHAWHLAMGMMEQAPHMDYISDDKMFEMDIYIDNVTFPEIH